MLDRQMRLLLRLGAGFIATLGLAGLFAPTLIANSVGIPLDLDPELTSWNTRVSAALLLSLAGFMALGAAFFPERALRQSGALMLGVIALLALLLAIAPTPWRWGRVFALALALVFIVFYLKALRARLRHR